MQLGSQVLSDPLLARAEADRIMIVFTDGHYTGSDPVPDAAHAKTLGITVHSITFGNGANQSHMQSLATAGGGRHYHAPDAATLSDIFEELAATVAILTQ